MVLKCVQEFDWLTFHLYNETTKGGLQSTIKALRKDVETTNDGLQSIKKARRKDVETTEDRCQSIINPFISTVPYSGRITSVCLTWTYEEGLPLFKEDVVEYFPSVVLEESTTTAKLFVSGYSVFKTSFGIYGLRH